MHVAYSNKSSGGSFTLVLSDVLFLNTLVQGLFRTECFSRHQSSHSVFSRTFYFILDKWYIVSHQEYQIMSGWVRCRSFHSNYLGAQQWMEIEKIKVIFPPPVYIRLFKWHGVDRVSHWTGRRSLTLILLITNYCQFSCFAENSVLRGWAGAAPRERGETARVAPDPATAPTPAPDSNSTRAWKCCFYCQEEEAPNRPPTNKTPIKNSSNVFFMQ